MVQAMEIFKITQQDVITKPREIPILELDCLQHYYIQLTIFASKFYICLH